MLRKLPRSGEFVKWCSSNLKSFSHHKVDTIKELGDFSTIGTGARVIPGINIGENCLIGAGAVVTNNIPNYKKAYGVPARTVN